MLVGLILGFLYQNFYNSHFLLSWHGIFLHTTYEIYFNANIPKFYNHHKSAIFFSFTAIGPILTSLAVVRTPLLLVFCHKAVTASRERCSGSTLSCTLPECQWQGRAFLCTPEELDATTDKGRVMREVRDGMGQGMGRLDQGVSLTVAAES